MAHTHNKDIFILNADVAPTFEPKSPGGVAQVAGTSICYFHTTGTTWVRSILSTHSNEVRNILYSGTELPTASGSVIGDTKTVEFKGGTIVNYTWNGSNWIVDFSENYNFIGEINIVIDGQSNSIGQQASSTFPLKKLNNLKVWNGSSFVLPQLGVAPFNLNGADNMGLRFAEKIALENPQHRVNLIQAGNNGQPISYWISSPNDGLYDVLNKITASGLSYIDVYIWDQGESDNLNTNYKNDYQTLLSNLYSFPQIDSKTKFLNVGMYTGPSAVYPLKDIDLREIGQDSNEFTSYVNTKDLASYDNVHFTNESMIKLGYERIYNAYLNTPYVPSINNASNGNRLEDKKVLRGSDSSSLPKGSELLTNTYNHLNGFNDTWVSSTEDVFIIKNNRDSDNVILESIADVKVNGIYVGKGKGDIITNTVVGLALRSNTLGSHNSAFGNSSLFSNTTGSYCSAFGANSLAFNEDGEENTAIGAQASLNNVDGIKNVAVGVSALRSNISGEGNVCIGYSAGYYETDSNKLYIANDTTSTPLIGGDFADKYLSIGGTQRFSIPYNPDGSTVDAGNIFYGTDGELYFKDGSSAVSILSGGGHKILFDHYTDSTVGGAETDIYTNTLAANTLNANGAKVIATYGGNFVTVGTELTQLKVYFGGTAIWDSTGVAPTTGTTSWNVDVKIIRVSSTVVRYTVTLNTTGASGFVYATSGELTGLTLSSTNILKITGTSSGVGSGSGDIVGKMGYGEFKAPV